MKVLLTLEEGFAKTIFEGDKDGVEWFLKGFQYSRNTNLESPESIGVLTQMMGLAEGSTLCHWSMGALSAIQNKVGKLEVIE